MRLPMRACGAAVLAACTLGPACAGPLSVAAVEAPSAVARTRIVTASRFVHLFHGLEYDLIDALRAGRPLDGYLLPDFEERVAAAPGEPIPREAWIGTSSLKAPGAVRITDMAVHDLGDVAVASFRMSLDGPQQVLMVVDVWRRQGADDYRLQVRYTGSPAVDKAAPARGSPKPARPDGKG